jgi:Raf kinase inhibitor-like YbhB/YbcL family protein
MKQLLCVIATALIAASIPAPPAHAQATTPAAFQLASDDVKGGSFAPAQIANVFGCTGKNVSPHLAWKGAPAGTKSFVVTVYDPDAPTGSGFWHWVVFNIAPSTTEIPTGASRSKMPVGSVEGRTDFGTTGYGGPCPPAGDKPHRYIFTVYALKVDRLDLTADSPAALVGFMTNQNKLGSATFTARYGR